LINIEGYWFNQQKLKTLRYVHHTINQVVLTKEKVFRSQSSEVA